MAQEGGQPAELAQMGPAAPGGGSFPEQPAAAAAAGGPSLDDEFAKFSAEISAVEQEQEQKLPPPASAPPAAAQDGAGAGAIDDEFAKFTAEISAVEKEAEKMKPRRPVTATVSAKPMKASQTITKAPAPSVPPPKVSAPSGSLLQQFYEKNLAPSQLASGPPMGAPPPPPFAGWNHTGPPGAAPYDPFGAGMPPQAPGAGAYLPYGERAKMQAEAIAQVKQTLEQAEHKKEKAELVGMRQAAGQRWVDTTLSEWPEGDHRIFVGDLGSEVNDDTLSKAFARYPSFNKAKVVRDKRSGKSKGFGFVSLQDVCDFTKAMREMNGKYIGNRPCKLSKSTWDQRADNGYNVKKRKDGKVASRPGQVKSKKYHIAMPK